MTKMMDVHIPHMELRGDLSAFRSIQGMSEDETMIEDLAITGMGKEPYEVYIYRARVEPEDLVLLEDIHMKIPWYRAATWTEHDKYCDARTFLEERLFG